MTAIQGAFFLCFYFALQGFCFSQPQPNVTNVTSTIGLELIATFGTGIATTTSNAPSAYMPISTASNNAAITALTSSPSYTLMPIMSSTDASHTIAPTAKTSLPTPSANTTGPSKDSGLKLRTWVYIVTGAVVGSAVIIVIVIVALCCCKKSKTRVIPSGNANQMEPVGDEHHLVPPPAVEK